MTTDEQLYSRFLHGENDALDELLIRHKDGLIWFLYGIVKDLEDAEDLMMDTFALLISKKVNFKNNSTFKTWLYGIGRNLSKKHIRKKAYANERTAMLIQEQMQSISSDNDLLTELINARDTKMFYEALGTLKEEYSTVLYLQYIENLDTETMAKIMKKSTKQIYNLAARAKVALKKEIEMLEDK